MSDLCADTSDTGSVQIRASHSELSIANSSPRLESTATSSTACINDVVQPLRRDLSSDLLCPLCDQLFDRPVMVTCGHSYCEACIERHTRDTRSCVVCKHDVGPFEAMIPSITLHNMVRKLRSQENIEASSYDDLFICEENNSKIGNGKVSRTPSERSTKRRLFFSIAGPTICSSPIIQHRRRPLSPSARPSKSALKIPPENLNHSLTEIGSPPSNLFRRNGFGRRSERFTSATQAKSNSFLEETETPKVADESTDGKMKRNSFLRRSLNAFRSKTGRRTSFANSFASSQIPEEAEDQSLLQTAEKEETYTKPSKTGAKSLWRRLFMSKKDKIVDKSSVFHHQRNPSTASTVISFVRLENQHDDPCHQTALLSSTFALGYYTGIGRKFERIASGSEITLVVFGHVQAGKTTFVRAIRQLFLEGTDRVRVIPNAERYKLAGIGVMPFPEGDNRLPHFVSLVINKSADEEFVLDIIDPEYDNSNLPQAYMDSCDAAYFLVDARNCPSLLSACQIQRNFKTGERSHVQYEMIVNVPSADCGQPRVLSAAELETMAKKLTVREMSVNRLDKNTIEEMLISMCDRVISTRRQSSSPPTTPEVI